MGCKGNNHKFENCVCEVLRAVADAQDEVAGTDTDCDVSCHRSIRDLLAGAQDNNDLDTIPLILYCGDCSPFEGFGARSTNGGLNFYSSFFFRVTSVDDCCAKLELLLLAGSSNPKDPGDQFCDATDSDFYRSGICITVDLDCFCAVTCLDPVATLPYSSLQNSSGC